MQFVAFEPNKPQEVALSDNPGPFKLPSGSGCLFSLSDGRWMHLDGRTAQSVADLALQPGETFRVCLQGQPGGIAYWSVWLSPETEKGRTAAEAPDLERQLAESLQLVARRKGAIPAIGDTPVLAPTGTEGPAPLPVRKPAIAAVASAKRERHPGIPLNVAFREVVRFVCAELNASGEQWSENSRQDMISTVLIAAQKANLLCVWEREEAA